MNPVLATRTAQIITLALLGGLVVFACIVLVGNGGALDGQPDIVAQIGLGLAALMAALHWVVPNIVSKQTLASVDDEAFHDADAAQRFSMVVPAFQTRHIVACALLEGAAFFNLIAYQGSVYAGSLAAAAAMAVLMAIRFPTRSGVEFWVKDQIRDLEARVRRGA